MGLCIRYYWFPPRNNINEVYEPDVKSGSTNDIPIIEIRLKSGKSIKFINELTSITEQDWAEVTDLYISGQLFNTLINSVSRLRVTGRNAAANYLENLLSRHNVNQSYAKHGDEISQFIALENFFENILAAEKPQIQISSDQIDFGEVKIGDSIDRHLTITNISRGLLYIEIDSDEPWVLINPRNLTLYPSSEIPVLLKSDVSKLPYGGIFEAKINLWSSSSKKILSCKLLFKAPKLVVNNFPIDFGVVSEYSHLSYKFEIVNDGFDPLIGEFIDCPNWMDLSLNWFNHPFNYLQPSEHRTVEIKVDMARAIEYGDPIIDERKFRHEGIIKIISNGGNLEIPWKLEFPIVEILGNPIEFNHIQEGKPKDDWIFLKYRGPDKLTGKIENIPPWLSIEPTEFDCSPGSDLHIKVSPLVNKFLEKKKPGIYKSDLNLTTNHLVEKIVYSFIIDRPFLEVKTKTIDFEELKNHDEEKFKISIKNAGTGLLIGKLIHNDSNIKLEGQEGGECKFEISKDKEILFKVKPLLSQSGYVHGELLIMSNGGEEKIPYQFIHLNLPRYISISPTKLYLKWYKNNFRKPELIKITNTKPNEVLVKINHDIPWLECSTREVIVPAASSKQLKIWLKLKDLKYNHKQGEVILLEGKLETRITITVDATTEPYKNKEYEWEIRKEDGSVITTQYIGVLWREIESGSELTGKYY